MWMVWAGIDFHAGEHVPAERVLGQHALDGLRDDAGGRLFQHLREGALGQAAVVAAVPVVHLLFHLVAGYAKSSRR